ncbi:MULTISPECIES: hypothetical protein [Kocuria]|uniref:hypothetical protein n=1 Tax=Kocuria TaxID=57493 RepID=UPI0019D10924|nr:hypothetical protein [Kocuria sp. KRD140]
MMNAPATAAHVAYFEYAGDTLDPDICPNGRIGHSRSAGMWTLAISAACVGAALSRIVAR